MTDLFENERIDDLEINDLRLIQNAEGYCFTSDSVLLANLVKARKTDKILDVGAGSGIISILLAGKMGYGNVSALEIQNNMAALAARNVEMKGLNDKIVRINSSFQDFAKSGPAERFDVIVSNPPYKKPDSGEMDKNETRAVSKYELKLTLDELIENARRLLKFRGKFYMVHRADRMAECIYKLKQNNIEPKVMTLVYPKAEKSPDVVIYECIKGASEGVKINTLIVYDENGEYTALARKMYSKD